MKKLKRSVGVIVLGCIAGPALSALPVGNLVFSNPTAIISATDTVAVDVILTLDRGSSEFVFDKALPDFGLDLAELTDWNSVSDAHLELAIGCSNNFSSSCVAGFPYVYASNSNVTTLDAVKILPGATWNFTAGVFSPSHGTAAGGTYHLYSLAIALKVSGQQWTLEVDKDGLPVFNDEGMPVFGLQAATAYIPLFDTCGFAGDSADVCSVAFSRTVAGPVPEPASAMLFLCGLGGLGFSRLAAVRRRVVVGQKSS